MKEKKTIYLKQYGIWIWLLAKRMLKQPAYIGLLVLIPFLGYAVSVMEQGKTQGAVVAVCAEEGAWSSQVLEGLRMQEADSVLRFDLCEDQWEVERSVMKGEADCGFVIAADLAERVMQQDWRQCILMYETSASSITGIAQERISGVIFRLYSEQCYEDYMRALEEKMPDDAFVDFAQNAYELHLTDGSTFEFRYENEDQYSQYKSDTNVINDTSVFPIKGVFAVIIFISGMCGMLEYDRDKREKRFLRLAPRTLTYIVDVWIPTVFVSGAVLLCMWISDGIRYVGGAEGIGYAGGMEESDTVRAVLSVWSFSMWGSQIAQLVLYQGIIVVYCCILGIALKRQETIAVAIPILSLGSLVCAPVFIRLAAYLPIFGVLEKLFPVTYYLGW